MEQERAEHSNAPLARPSTWGVRKHQSMSLMFYENKFMLISGDHISNRSILFQVLVPEVSRDVSKGGKTLPFH